MAKNTLLVKISIGLALYGILCLIQAYGLHKRKRWAEYLTVVAIGLLIPFEIYEVVHRLTVLRVAVLVLNIVIVYYLMKHKEFFPKRTQLPKLTP